MERITLASEEGVSVAVGCGVLCMVFRGAHDPTCPERTSLWVEQAVKAVGVPALPVMTVIEAQAESPDSAGRRGYSESLRRDAPYMECVTQVIMVKGLMGAAYRAIAGTIYAVARQPTRTKILGSVEEAADWITDFSSVCTVSSEVLLSSINSVRSA